MTLTFWSLLSWIREKDLLGEMVKEISPDNAREAFISAGEHTIKKFRKGRHLNAHIASRMSWYENKLINFTEKNDEAITDFFVAWINSELAEVDSEEWIHPLEFFVESALKTDTKEKAIVYLAVLSLFEKKLKKPTLNINKNILRRITEQMNKPDKNVLMALTYEITDLSKVNTLDENLEKTITAIDIVVNKLEDIAVNLREKMVFPDGEVWGNLESLKNNYEEIQAETIKLAQRHSVKIPKSPGVEKIKSTLEELNKVFEANVLGDERVDIELLLDSVCVMRAENKEADEVLAALRQTAREKLKDVKNCTIDKLKNIREEVVAFSVILDYLKNKDSLGISEKKHYRNHIEQVFGEDVAIVLAEYSIQIELSGAPESESKHAEGDKIGKKVKAVPEGTQKSSRKTEKKEVSKAEDKSDSVPVKKEKVEPEPVHTPESQTKPETEAESTLESKPIKTLEQDARETVQHVANEVKEDVKLIHVEEEEVAETDVKPAGSRPVAEMVGQINDSESVSDETWNDLLIGLLDEGNLEWAYWLSKSLGDNASIPEELCELVQLGSQFQPGFSKSEERLSFLFSRVTERHLIEDIEDNIGAGLMVMAGVIRPALMSPLTYPSAVLRLLGVSLKVIDSRFEDFAESLASFADRGVPLAGELLQDLGMFASWEQQKNDLEFETKTWLIEAPQRKIKYGAATSVWKYWVSEKGALRALVLESEKKPDKMGRLSKEIDRWSNENNFSKLLSEASRALFPKKKSRKSQIDYTARDALERYVDDALELVKRWQSLHLLKPSQDGGMIGFSRETLEKLKEPAESIMRAINGLGGDQSQPVVAAGVKRLGLALGEIISKFQSDKIRQRTDDPVESKMEEVMLLASVDTEEPTGSSLKNLKFDIARHLQTPVDIKESIRRHLEKGHIGLVKHVLRTKKPEELHGILQSMQDEIAASERKWKNVAFEHIEKTSDRLSTAYFNMVIDKEEDYSRYGKQLQILSKHLEDDEESPDQVIRKCADILADIEKLFAERLSETLGEVNRIRQSLDKKGIKIPLRFDAVLKGYQEREELSSINELVALGERALKAGSNTVLEQIPPIKSELSYFERYFEVSEKIYSEVVDPVRLQRGIKNKKITSIPAFDKQSSEEREDTSEAIKRWLGINSPGTRGDYENSIVARFFSMLRWLGFHIEAAERLGNPVNRAGSPHFWRHYRINATIESPVPLFGSMSHGKLDIILVWNSPEPDMIVNYLKAQMPKNSPVLVFYFGRLRPAERRRFIHLSRGEGYCPLVIDLCLYFWLCSFRAAERSKAMFGVGIYGGYNNPYTPEMAGSVPPETFFGRENDIEDIWRLDGPCIVYGGRQLGKSALLQEVRRRYHNPKKNHYVFYSGVKTSAAIWPEIQSKIVEARLIKESRRSRDDKIKKEIQDLLNKKKSMRILILLDECDYFFDQDSEKQFEQISLVRDLMAETNRRFKVVFTGLHSVQRFQRIPNQPLAHFSSICVGPLEPVSARELVRKPLADLGYVFQPMGLIERILALTNYHPSLIQFFCSFLVKNLLTRKTYKMERTPPFEIDSKIIDQVYSNRDLMKRMRERFDWTLDLDPRYRAIGYLIAYLEMVSNEDEGFSVREILEDLRAYWPAGFDKANVEEISGLLDEMVGLGLLIDTVPGRKYKLRSPNVLRLLGGEEAVLDELAMLHDVGFEQRSDPQVLRRVLSRSTGHKKKFMTSPMTMKQENGFLQRESGIDLIVGSKALRIDEVPEAIADLFYTRNLPEPEYIVDNELSNPGILQDFVEERLKPLGSREGKYFLLRWNGNTELIFRDLVHQLTLWVNKNKKRSKFARFGIIIGPETCWRLITDGDLMPYKENPDINPLRLGRWREPGLSHWFHDMDIVPGESSLPNQWVEATGGWPMVLGDVQQTYITENRDPVKSEDFLLEEYNLIENAGLCIDEDISETYRTLCELDEEVSSLDLADLIDDIAPEKIGHIVEYLLDLDLAIGTPASLKPEPALRRLITEST